MTETCNAVGYLTVGGRKVGLLKCEGREGHELPTAIVAGSTLPEISMTMEAAQRGGENIIRTVPGEPHSMTLRWDAEVLGIDWPEALDPEETFDVEVPLAPSDDDLALDEMPDLPPGLCGANYEAPDGRSGRCVYIDGHVSPHSWARA